MSASIVLFVILIASLIGFFAVRPILRMRAKAKHLVDSGQAQVATVLEISQTGNMVNQLQQMRLKVEIQQAGGAPRQISFTQLVDLGSMPRAGQLVYVLTDPTDPTMIMLAGAPAVQPFPIVAPAQTQDAELNPQQELDMAGITPRLREHGKVGVASVLAVQPAASHATTFTLEIDSVLQPKRTVTVTQLMYGESYAVGDRVYLLIDPENPGSLALMPLSLTGGTRIDPRNNRLDALALGPQLLHLGAKATGTVLSAEQGSVSTPQLAAKGYVKYHLKMHIVPADGSPAFDAEQTLTFTDAEKVQRMATVGAEVPVRYDVNDRRTFATDSLAMGYPDPYEETLAGLKANLAAG